MSQLLSQTAKLVPYPKRLKSLASLATAYDFEPPAPMASLGTLLIVIEVVSVSKQAEELIDLIIETTGKSYYEEASTELASPQDRFDAAIKRVNEELAIYATQGNAAWVGKISAVIAILRDDELMITQTGSAAGYLYRHGHGTCITAELGTNQPHRPSKTFSNAATGSVQAGDRLLLSTPALLHIIPASELASVLLDNSASASAEKCRGLLADHEGLERIAATITELSTPEMAQMTPQTGLPKELHLGRPESVTQAAKYNLAPLLRRLGSGLQRVWQRSQRLAADKLLPTFKLVSLKTVKLLREWLSNRRGRWVLLGVLAILAGLVWLVIHATSSSAATSKLVTRYHQAYALTTQSNRAATGGDKLTAKKDLEQALALTTALAKDKNVAKLDKSLADEAHPEDDPASVTGLAAAIKTKLDALDDLTRISPKLLVDFASIGNASPTMLAAVGGRLIAVDPSGSSSSLYSYDLSSRKIDNSLIRSSSLGKVVAIAAASTGDGVYLLTNRPDVWFYRISDHSLTAQTTAGSWPSGQAMASFGGNLYILTADHTNIEKLTKSAAGFSAPTGYLPSGQTLLAGARSLAIDGSVYVGTSSGYKRFLTGTLQSNTVVIPSDLSQVDQIVSAADGTTIVTADAATDRIGLYSFDGTNSRYLKQLALNGYPSIGQLAGDPNARIVYALAGQKLVSFSY